MASLSAEPQQNVVVKVGKLPLVSSTCDMLSSVYTNTKKNHPYLKSVCEVAERRVKIINAVTLRSTKHIIQKWEPQLALANNYARISLDKIEEKLPILLQPTYKTAADATDMVANAKEAITRTVTGAKDTVAHMITGVVDKTKGAVQESMEMTKAVTGSINTVLGSRIVQMMSTGIDAALTKSEALVDHYLPLTEEEVAKKARGEGFEAGTQEPSYYIRLGSLSSKVHRRVYEQALTRVKDAKCRSQDAISQLYTTIYLFKHTESPMFAIVQDLSHQLQTTCLTLVSSIQDQVHSAHTMARNIYQNFISAASFRDVSDQLFSISKAQLKKMDYLNIPLSCLGCFYHQLQPVEEKAS
ncbi:perilipin-2-like isoform X2 [Rhinatrema bivittatum]|uniref:perilipin-2-like isoform X2 n=1 Tax=Rhinatrema bivittatum TaxID=194408 RepID=UPI00112D530A|nr:perilipin-2-like isoform X2 [Rhinatrema bivittatum]